VATPLAIVAVSALLICGANCGPLQAQEIASTSSAGEAWCGQYECVTSLPLSEREVEVSLATLAAVRPIVGAKPLDQTPTSSVRQGTIAVSARD